MEIKVGKWIDREGFPKFYTLENTISVTRSYLPTRTPKSWIEYARTRELIKFSIGEMFIAVGKRRIGDGYFLVPMKWFLMHETLGKHCIFIWDRSASDYLPSYSYTRFIAPNSIHKSFEEINIRDL